MSDEKHEASEASIECMYGRFWFQALNENSYFDRFMQKKSVQYTDFRFVLTLVSHILLLICDSDPGGVFMKTSLILSSVYVGI